MSERKDGGPAFPTDGFKRDAAKYQGDWGQPGMPLRDWFAGQFAAAMLVGTLGRFDDGTLSAYRSGKCNHVIADRAYTLADAMLAARSDNGSAGR